MSGEDKLNKGSGGRPTRKDAEAIDARILSAAATLFIERGVDGTSLEAVAAAAAVSKPTLYARYADKTQLFTAVIRTNVSAAMPAFKGTGIGSSTEERLRHVGRAMIEGALQPTPLGLMRLYIAEALRHGPLIRALDRTGREVAVTAIAGAISAPKGASTDRARIIAGHFLDMVFVPHLMRALLDDLPDENDPLHPSLKERIDTAVAALGALAILPPD